MSAIQKLIQNDCCLMFEAMRRLIDGTCCLQGEENLSAWDLFGKLQMAFLEHVEFEEAHVLDALSLEERELHRAEHFRLCELFKKIESKLECMDGVSFRAALCELMAELKSHHAHDVDMSETDRLINDKNVQRFVERSNHMFL